METNLWLIYIQFMHNRYLTFFFNNLCTKSTSVELMENALSTSLLLSINQISGIHFRSFYLIQFNLPSQNS